MKTKTLSDYAEVLEFSQWGEEGIIAEIFSRIGTNDKTCVEFGAADGLFCSNTANLWRNEQWSAQLFELDEVFMDDLIANTSDYPLVNIEMISVDNIDELVPSPVDLVSMDVDGNEYSIFLNMEVKHRVLIVEHNPTFPPHIHFWGGTGQGSSALALCELAERKGYKFVAATLTNLFFVLEEYSDKFEDLDTSLASNFDHTSLNYVVTDYCGNYDIKGLFPYGFSQHTSFDVEGSIPEHVAKYVLSDLNTQKMIWNRFTDFPAEKRAVSYMNIKREDLKEVRESE